MDAGQLAHDIEQVIYHTAKYLLYPVLVAAILCLVWVLIELGWLLYEIYLRVRYRDLEALEARTLRARQAFANGQPRKAYKYLQENNYSMVVVRFLFDLIRNYQTDRLAEKPLKLLQEYEFYTIKRLEKTRILVRVGPMLGLMGTLIPLSPALVALANGDTAKLADNLVIAFSVTVLGLLIGGLAFVISIVRDRFYSQDISDLEYLLELLEGSGQRLQSGRARQERRATKSTDEADADKGEADDGDADHGDADHGDAEPGNETTADAADRAGAPPLLAATLDDDGPRSADDANGERTVELSLDELSRRLEADLLAPPVETAPESGEEPLEREPV
jgi:biopolymer transport protein ExbB/TolQ